MNDSTSAIALTAETASEYDFVLVLDASGSMNLPSKRYQGKSRWQELQETALGLAHVLAKYDDDGIDVVTFGGSVKVFEGVTPDKVSDVFSTVTPNGGTPLDEAIRQVVALNADGKKAVAIVFTDGEPNNQQAAVDAIVQATQAQEKDEDFTLLFVQIGDDAGAAKFLEYLDDGLVAKGAKFDIVDTISAAIAETMEPIDLINKAIND